MTQTYEKGQLYQLSIIDLKTDPKQPRKSIDSLALEGIDNYLNAQPPAAPASTNLA